MPTECSPELFEFAPVEGRVVIAGFDGGAITSDAGALLLAATDRAIRLRVENVFGGGFCRHDPDVTVVVHQQPQNILLDPIIVSDHAITLLAIPRARRRPTTCRTRHALR